MCGETFPSPSVFHQKNGAEQLFSLRSNGSFALRRLGSSSGPIGRGFCRYGTFAEFDQSFHTESQIKGECYEVPSYGTTDGRSRDSGPHRNALGAVHGFSVAQQQRYRRCHVSQQRLQRRWTHCSMSNNSDMAWSRWTGVSAEALQKEGAQLDALMSGEAGELLCSGTVHDGVLSGR